MANRQTSTKLTSPSNESSTFDPVTAPAHYCQVRFPYVAVVVDWKLDFFLGQVIKYINRYQLKDGLQDLKKARAYLNMKIELLEKGELKETIKYDHKSINSSSL